MHERSAKHYVSPFSFAGIHAQLGDVDESFEWLERAYLERDAGLGYLNFERFSAMRSDPRMIDLVRRMGLPEG